MCIGKQDRQSRYASSSKYSDRLSLGSSTPTYNTSQSSREGSGRLNDRSAAATLGAVRLDCWAGHNFMVSFLFDFYVAPLGLILRRMSFLLLVRDWTLAGFSDSKLSSLHSTFPIDCILQQFSSLSSSYTADLSSSTILPIFVSAGPAFTLWSCSNYVDFYGWAIFSLKFIISVSAYGYQKQSCDRWRSYLQCLNLLWGKSSWKLESAGHFTWGTSGWLFGLTAGEITLIRFHLLPTNLNM